MKKLFLSAIVIAALASCKKEYHCTCEIVSEQGNQYMANTHSFKETKDGAVETCQSQEESIKLTNSSASCSVVPE